MALIGRCRLFRKVKKICEIAATDDNPPPHYSSSVIRASGGAKKKKKYGRNFETTSTHIALCFITRITTTNVVVYHDCI